MTAADPHAADRRPTGVRGLDPVLAGGLPRQGLVLIVGGPGSGKSILAAEIAARAAAGGTPTVFVSFEERPEQLLRNSASFGWGLERLVPETIRFLHARIPVTDVRTGGFDVNGLLATVGSLVDEIGAQQVILDGVDVLLGSLGADAAERFELLRIGDWLQEREVTGILTSKTSDGSFAGRDPYGELPFLADCVLHLTHEAVGGVVTRHLRVVKYRGANPATQPVPMLIGRRGMEVLGLQPGQLRHKIFDERVSSGVAGLDRMLEGGFHRGSSILLSGSPGTTKSSLACAFAAAQARAGERVLYVSFDETGEQLVRNLASIGVDLATPLAEGRLEILAQRTLSANANEHVARIGNRIEELRPGALVVDPVSAFTHTAIERVSDEAVLRLIDLAKGEGITLLMTALLQDSSRLEESTESRISTLADTWIQLAYKIQAGERNRSLTIVKSRGTSHSNQVRELLVDHQGLHLKPVFAAGGEVLMGTLRWEKEEELRRERRKRQADAEQRRRELRAALELARGEAASSTARVENLERELHELAEERSSIESLEDRRREAILRIRQGEETRGAELEDGTAEGAAEGAAGAAGEASGAGS